MHAFKLRMTGSRRAMAPRSSGARNLISTMPSGSSTPPRAPVSAYISTCGQVQHTVTLPVCHQLGSLVTGGHHRSGYD
jgi:hypothetical protein